MEALVEYIGKSNVTLATFKGYLLKCAESSLKEYVDETLCLL